MNRLLETVGTGAAAGVAATVPMAAIQVVGYHAGLSGTVPPDQVTRSLLGTVGLLPHRRPQKDLVVTASHLSYGAAMGVLFALTHERWKQAAPPVLLGAGFGLAVWVSSYSGWIPATGVLPPPQDARKGGVAANVTAHLVYGAVLGWIVGRRDRARSDRDGTNR